MGTQARARSPLTRSIAVAALGALIPACSKGPLNPPARFEAEKTGTPRLHDAGSMTGNAGSLATGLSTAQPSISSAAPQPNTRSSVPQPTANARRGDPLPGDSIPFDCGKAKSNPYTRAAAGTRHAPVTRIRVTTRTRAVRSSLTTRVRNPACLTW